jgi:hypothetical protein
VKTRCVFLSFYEFPVFDPEVTIFIPGIVPQTIVLPFLFLQALYLNLIL